MSEVRNTFELIVEELTRAIAYAGELIGDPASEPLKLLYLLRELGWDVPIDTDLSGTELSVINRVASINDALSRQDYAELVSAIRDTIDSFDDITNELNLNLGTEFTNSLENKLPGKILDYVVIQYLEDEHPKLFGLMVLLGIFEIEYVEPSDTIEVGYIKREIHWNLLSTLFSDPKYLISSTYGWGSPDFRSDLMLENLQGMLTALDIPASHFDADSAIRTGLNVEKHCLSIPIVDWSDFQLGLEIYPLPPDQNQSDAGLGISPYVIGSTDRDIEIDELLSLEIESSLNLDKTTGFTIRPGEGVRFYTLSDPSISKGSFDAKMIIKPTSGKLFGGNLSGTHIELAGLAIGLSASFESGVDDFAIEIDLRRGSLIICAGDGDGFIQKILPRDPVQIDFDLTLGISKHKGFYVRGGAGFEYTFYINKSFGPIFINTVDLMLEIAGNDIILIAAASGGAQIGPVTAAVQKIGLETTLELGKPGLLGKADLSLGFKPPSGVALFAKTATVSGGGLLLVEDGNYTGLLYLDIKDRISITAVGILTTRMPDGSKIFSLKIIGMVEFPPIQLGYGFILTGVGLAIAIECCMNEEALREGVYTGSLRSLFLSDPADNPMQLITDLQNFFPPTRDYYVFGFMAKLGWGGATSLIKADVGIFIEIGGPGRLALAGIAHAELPNEDAPKVILQLQVLGLLDLGDKTLSIDSSLTGSRLLDWPLDGDIIVRSNWGDNPRFLLSAGGKFFPGYPIPPGVPPGMQLISVSLGSGNPRVGLFLYNAITENSVHFGASLQFHYHKDLGRIIGLIELDGGTSFDALFNFNPFYFKARMSAWLDLKRNGDRVMGVDVRLHLKGPNNYHAWGYAQFEICGFDKTIPFDKTFGRKRPELPQSILSPREALEAELDEPKNWNILLPPRNASRVISCKDQQEELVDPFGIIRFSQKSVPLDLEIEKFGKAAIPTDEDYFDILADDDMKTEIVEEFFAPGEFVYLSNAEKISAPPFEKFKSGVEIAGANINMPDQSLREDIELEYETKFPGQSTYTPRLVLPVVLLNVQRIGGQKVHNKIKAKPASETKAGITINDQKFTAVTSYATGGKFERVTYEKDGELKEAGNLTYARARQMKDKIGTRDSEILDTEKAISLS